jgi:hypothetical protein
MGYLFIQPAHTINMDKDFCILTVLLLSEGTVRIHNNKASIVFTNTSEELNKAFRDSAERLGFKTFKKSPKQTAIYSKRLATELLDKCKSFRSKPCSSGIRNACPVTMGKTNHGPSCKSCKPFRAGNKDYPPSSFPAGVLKAKKEDLAGYLRLFFTCEGGVVIGSDMRNDEIMLRVGHPILRKQALDMIKSLGIVVKVRGESLLYIKKRSEMIKFRNLIGFVDGAKSVRGSHKGTQKNKLLEFVLNRHGFVQTARQANRVGFW